MLPFSMIAKKTVWSSCATRLFYMGDIFVVPYWLPIFFQTVKGVSPVRSGYYTSAVILIQAVFAVISSVAGKHFKITVI